MPRPTPTANESRTPHSGLNSALRIQERIAKLAMTLAVSTADVTADGYDLRAVHGAHDFAAASGDAVPQAWCDRLSGLSFDLLSPHPRSGEIPIERSSTTLGSWRKAQQIAETGRKIGTSVSGIFNGTSRRLEIRRWRPSRPESARNLGSSGPMDLSPKRSGQYSSGSCGPTGSCC
jgi:hypothetical protein